MTATSTSSSSIPRPRVIQVFRNHSRTIVVPTRRPPAEAASYSGRRSLTDLLRMGWAVAGPSPVVFFFPLVYTFFPLLRPVKCVLAIQDVIAERHPSQGFVHLLLQLF